MKKLLFFAIVILIISVSCLGGYVWWQDHSDPMVTRYEYMYKTEIYDEAYNACMASWQKINHFELKTEYHCECFAKKLETELYNAKMRESEIRSKFANAERECNEYIKYSNMPTDKLLEMFKRQCKEIYTTKNPKFCECLSASMVYLIKQQNNESAIVRNMENMINKSSELCRGLY